MISNPNLENLLYLSILFKSMKGLFEIKILDPLDDEFNFVYEILSENNNLNPVHKPITHNRFFEFLNLSLLQQRKDLKHNGNFSTSNEQMSDDIESKAQGSLKNFESKNVTYINFSDKNSSLDNSSKKYQNPETDQNKPCVKNIFKKESDFKVKNYLNIHNKNNFLTSVKVSLDFFKEKSINIQKKILEDSFENKNFYQENSDEFSLLKDSNNQSLAFNNSGLDHSFSEAINNQSFIISNNKIDELMPFGVVGYHFKEDDKKNTSKRKKKKKKVLFRNDIKYINEKF